MGKAELEQIRYMCEVHFRESLYKDVKFKYMPCMGIKDIFQSFANDNLFVGVIHLNYRKGEEGKMYWHSSWFDLPEDAIQYALRIRGEKIYNEELLMQAVHDHIRDLYIPPEKQTEKKFLN